MFNSDQLFEAICLAVGTACTVQASCIRLHRLECMWMWYRAHVVAHLPGLQMLDGRAVGPEEPQQAVQALRHEEVLMAIMLSSACLVHKLVCCSCRILCKWLLQCRHPSTLSCFYLSLVACQPPIVCDHYGAALQTPWCAFGPSNLLCDPCK